MNTLMTNIDDVRVEIMRLENLGYFDRDSWENLLMNLEDYPCRLADIRRRMQSARERYVTIDSRADFSIPTNIV